MEKLNLGQQLRFFAVSCVIAVSLIACGGDDATDGNTSAQKAVSSQSRSSAKSGSAPMLAKYIPADTPYYYATLKQSPDALNEKMWEIFTPVFESGQQLLTTTLNDLNSKAQLSDDETLAKLLLEEFDGNLNREGLSKLGLKVDDIAFYGDGILPVVRLQLADMQALEATIKRIEGKIGESLPVKEQDGKQYYTVGDEKASMVAYVGNNQLVMSIAPANAGQGAISRLVSDKTPSSNIINRAKSVGKQYGFSAYGLMEINLPQIVDSVLLDNSETAVAMFSEIRNEVSDVCASEIRGMAEVAPRIISAYTDMSTREIKQHAIIELRSDIAEGLSAVTVPMKGIEQPGNGVLAMAMSMNIINAKQFMLDRIAAIKADPYECEEFAAINQGLEQAELGLNQPLPPFVGNIQGFRFNLKNMDVSPNNPIPTNVKASAMIGISNPQLLLGMAGAFVPQLADLALTNDGQPVAFPAGVIPPFVESPHVAMMDHGFAVSVGAGEESGLKSYLDADAPSGAAPFMSYNYDTSFFLNLQKMGLDQSMAEQDSPMPEGFGDLYDAYLEMAGAFGRNEGQMLFTGNGVEIKATTYLTP